MDDAQKNVVTLLKENPDGLQSRSRFRSLLLDYLPNDKMHQNLLLSAYDEDIVQSLSAGSDKTLAALRLIKVLQDNYGITAEASMWTIKTYCYLLNLGEIADAIGSISPNNAPTPVKKTAPQQSTLRLGVYKAGVDFPAGELSIQVTKKTRLGIYYGISKNPNRIEANNSFMDKAYIRIDEGQYLKLFSFETGGDYSCIIKKED